MTGVASSPLIMLFLKPVVFRQLSMSLTWQFEFCLKKKLKQGFCLHYRSDSFGLTSFSTHSFWREIQIHICSQAKIDTYLVLVQLWSNCIIEYTCQICGFALDLKTGNISLSTLFVTSWGSIKETEVSALTCQSRKMIPQQNCTQDFLNDGQYQRNGILRYERVFGKTYVSTGGETTTKVTFLSLPPIHHHSVWKTTQKFSFFQA